MVNIYIPTYSNCVVLNGEMVGPLVGLGAVRTLAGRKLNLGDVCQTGRSVHLVRGAVDRGVALSFRETPRDVLDAVFTVAQVPTFGKSALITERNGPTGVSPGLFRYAWTMANGVTSSCEL